MDWEECNKKDLVKEVKADKNLTNSLIKSSEKKLKTQSLLDLNETTATSKISLSYEALRELLEALAISNGFKIYNHECYYAFLKEILKKNDLGREFDNFRKLRNAINYYGKDISKEEAKEIMENIIKLIEKVKNIL
ncbi:MAG: hypothetical protein KKH88_02915 [Nanoarchaeota archaeon]|nr:hypothetical protein [Nanoarchaeota archaeon]MBU1445161.1 hypothetical protein [Nanoarchaeota archaeon]MBU2420888.1 hypothetical protein [Nanoarchaeota archaeon]MBU2475359.1 hypothetical protein [Nanoarchaeota archaeon]MBU3940849.1 hypothetical protein [Nanoarchaeota archaeon]